MATLDSPAKSALFPAKRLLAFPIMLGINNHVSVAVREEYFQANVKADFLISDRKRNVFCFADNENVPMTISPKDKVSRLRRSFEWAVHLDFEALANLGREPKPIAFQPGIFAFGKLPQLDTVPMQGILKAWLKLVFLTLSNDTVSKYLLGFVSFPGFMKTVGKHLYGRRRNVFGSLS